MFDEFVNCNFSGSDGQDNRMFRIRMLGTFEIREGDRVLTEEMLHSRQLLKLAAAICIHGTAGESASGLIDLIWPSGQSENPSGALKNLMYRLRRCTRAIWPDTDLFITSGGRCRWNPELAAEFDTERLSAFAHDLRSFSPETGSARTAQELAARYGGPFLRSLADDDWVILQQNFFRNRYLACAHEIASRLENESRYEALREFSAGVLQMEPYDETMHVELVKAYIGENRPVEAERHYQSAIRLLEGELGDGSAEHLARLYGTILEQSHSQEKDLLAIEEDLEGAEAQGAYECPYGLFKRIYELEKRRSGRFRQTITLVLITLHPRLGKNGKSLTDIGRAITAMEETLLASLRTGDLVSRYSSHQLLVMLSGCGEEEARAVIERLNRNYYEREDAERARIQYSVKEMP